MLVSFQLWSFITLIWPSLKRKLKCIYNVTFDFLPLSFSFPFRFVWLRKKKPKNLSIFWYFFFFFSWTRFFAFHLLCVCLPTIQYTIFLYVFSFSSFVLVDLLLAHSLYRFRLFSWHICLSARLNPIPLNLFVFIFYIVGFYFCCSFGWPAIIIIIIDTIIFVFSFSPASDWVKSINEKRRIKENIYTHTSAFFSVPKVI